nr:hypothetical protein GCM10020092_083320 [Actinoplanes digitatis]
MTPIMRDLAAATHSAMDIAPNSAPAHQTPLPRYSSATGVETAAIIPVQIISAMFQNQERQELLIMAAPESSPSWTGWSIASTLNTAYIARISGRLGAGEFPEGDGGGGGDVEGVDVVVHRDGDADVAGRERLAGESWPLGAE